VNFVSKGIEIDGSGEGIAAMDVADPRIGKQIEGEDRAWLRSTRGAASIQRHRLVSPLRSSVHSASGSEGGPMQFLTK
jgi:hypothetical protein